MSVNCYLHKIIPKDVAEVIYISKYGKVSPSRFGNDTNLLWTGMNLTKVYYIISSH